MLMNNLDPEVAERPDDLVVYGGTGRAARSWAAFDAIVRELPALADDETLLVASGKPVAVFRTHEWAPRVLIANSNLVGRWATWETFRELERAGLTMYGQMTAGSWIYIGSQGILQGTYETFAELARQHFGGIAARAHRAHGRPGRHGWRTAAGGDHERRRGPLHRGRPGAGAAAPRDALRGPHQRGPRRGAGAGPARRPRPAARSRSRSSATPPSSSPSWCDAASASTRSPTRPPRTMPSTATSRPACRSRRPTTCGAPTRTTTCAGPWPPWPTTSARCWRSKAAGAITFDYGNNIRAQAQAAGVADAFDIPGFVPAFIRPQFCEGRGPFRWAALSGDPADIARTDEAVLDLFPADASLHRWIRAAQERVAFQGLPARICWLGYGERARAGLAFNELVRSGAVSAPIVIGRDHLDAGSVASPNRETEAMRDGSDAIADWPMLNALVNTAAGATWVSIHHGGGTGIGYSQHAGMVVVADGTDLAAAKLERVLTTDPGMGVVRHVDAGYERAIDVARERGVHIPMLDA